MWEPNLTKEAGLKRAHLEFAVVLIAATACVAFFVRIDAFELIVDYVHSHESWELDEIIMGATIFGVAGFGFGAKRYIEALRALQAKTKAEQDAKWAAHHDPLTAAKNQRFLSDFLAAHPPLENSDSVSPLAIFSIDLNNFKLANDNYGHCVGDKILSQVAVRLRDLFPNDKIVRMGGDEFLVLADRTELEDVAATGRMILEALGRSHWLKGYEIRVGACVGCASYPEDGSSLQAILRGADLALYEAKRTGRSELVLFDDDLRAKADRRNKLEGLFERGLRAGDIVPHYQPFVDLKTGRVMGFEALARWTLEDGETVPPREFVPMAEDKGIMPALTETILLRMIDDTGHWPHEMKVCINLSASQLSDPLLAERLLRLLAGKCFPPERLEVEITENALANDPHQARSNLETFRVAGVSVALDDFGTGASNLAQIHEFTFDRLKIDRSFTSNLPVCPKQRAIVQAIINLSQDLSLEVTAEGIEDAGQAAALRDMGCQGGQGFLFGYPVPAEDASTFIHSDFLARQLP